MSQDPNWLDYLQGRDKPRQSVYQVGPTRYGANGTGVPNSGPTANTLAYQERDNLAKQRRSALLRRMQAGQKNNFMNSDWLGSNGY